MDEPIGLAVVARDMPAIREGRVGPSGQARLLSLTVSRDYRRIGVGSALLRAIEAHAAEARADELSFSYAFTGEQLEVAEAFFRKAGWSAPAMTMLHCRADRAMLKAPLMQDALELPAEYEIVDWIDISATEREAIAARQAQSQWFPPDLDPFHFERGLELLNSLALRYRGEVVGWLLTSRTTPTTIHYRCLFVRPDLAKLGRGLSMVVEAIRRQQKVWDVFAPDTGHGEWGTPSTLPAMVRFIRRHLAPYTEVTERRVVRRTLDGSTPQETPGARPDFRADDVRRLRVLTREQCAAIRSDVLALREHWVRRERSPCFHTLGRSFDLDGTAGSEQFGAMTRPSNQLLRERFASVYAAVAAALASVLGAPVRLHDTLPVPGFRMLGDERGATLPIAPVRCDYAPDSLTRGSSWPAAPLSFILTIAGESDASLHAMSTWPLDAARTVGLDTDEIDRLLDHVSPRRHRAAPGELLFFPSLVFHQAAPRVAGGTEPRITLEGRAFRTQASWDLYW